MKPLLISMTQNPRSGWLAVATSFIFLVGCSGGGAGQGSDGTVRAGDVELTRSEFIALKKANKNPRDFKKALLARQRGELESDHFDVGKTHSQPPGRDR
jgi:hypothetical protein